MVAESAPKSGAATETAFFGRLHNFLNRKLALTLVGHLQYAIRLRQEEVFGMFCNMILFNKARNTIEQVALH